MIQLTAAAIQEINRLRDRQNLTAANFRLDIRPSGCAQWAYQLSFESVDLNAGSETNSTTGSDDIYDFGNVRVVVSQTNRAYLENLKIDFSEDLMGGAFRFDNPQATESCRCGYAFAIAPADPAAEPPYRQSEPAPPI
ncbi:iron-sulfur cluster assembly accessory protein [Romeria aff. gracilis LEGE 07310]|uniref:Iron-sulfur cluster assembly accessory protein n=1 Tax=Vasconcelosia minhoensis LEGE 07310 TaxID=915328 RepID=A0A8J7DR56_9CYAN|nr:iron-sulfur cluster assembly accessory protein [Romeria gracilis]MBE9077824.1 iron-sulfur cluster assembly accessory protein [Romeria aff. gracilis LEGE 07310]